MQSRRTRRSIAWCAVLVLSFTGITASQTRPDGQWIAISSRIVKMEVYIPKGRWVRVAVQEGMPARISDSDLNLSLALVPVLAGRHVKVHAFHVNKLQTGEERFHWLKDIDTLIGATTTTKVSSSRDDLKASVELLVKVVEVVKAATPGGPGEEVN